MQIHRNKIAVLAMTLIGLSVGIVLADRDRPLRGFMREKIGYAQAVLEGITLENFHMAVTNAVMLRNMPLTNSAFGMTHVEYRANITNFQASVDAVIEAARTRDLDKATEAYTAMARSCVQCHKDFRREQFIKHQLEQK